MLEDFQALRRIACVVLIVSGASWILSAIFWHWQRYWVLRLFRSGWWRKAKMRKTEIRLSEKLARAVARSDPLRIVTAVIGFLLFALGIAGLSVQP